ncbi:MAG: heparan-alpha-glucosaminide N-acetyltransferase [Fastidiosipilaceae bacterium]|nr:DUF1624 domain-containing protein [Clostridiaceae bacterium]
MQQTSKYNETSDCKRPASAKVSYRNKGGRYHLIDAFRGLAMIAMIFYHFVYDVQVIYYGNGGWPLLSTSRIWQQYICWTFIFVSGYVWAWSWRKIFQRGLILNLLGLGITAVTVLVMPEEAIYFGVLNLIGCSIWLMGLVERGTRNWRPWLGAFLAFILFLLCYEVPWGSFGLGIFHPTLAIDLPKTLYSSIIFVPLGLPPASFSSSDYFPLLPWFWLFVTGHFVRQGLSRIKNLENILRTQIPVLSSWGRYTLPIYLLHQPLLILFLEVWHNFFNS